ncbi:MAG: carbohydrate-binding protein [Clostridiales bacterium]
MKTGTILELNKKDVVIISEDSKFIAIKRKDEMYIGQQIIFDKSDIIPEKFNISKFVAYSVACLVILFLGIRLIGINHLNSTNEFCLYVELESDERLSMKIDIEGNLMNSDQISDKYKGDKKNKFNKDDLTKEYLNNIVKNGVKEDRFLVVSISTDNNVVNSSKKIDTMIGELKEIIDDYSDEFSYMKLITLSDTEIKNAQESNLSPAKYHAYLEYKKDKEEIDLKEAANLTIKGAYTEKDANKTSEWEIGFYYKTGEKVFFEEDEYICLNSHVSQDDWSPKVAVSLWKISLKEKSSSENVDNQKENVDNQKENVDNQKENVDNQKENENNIDEEENKNIDIWSSETNYEIGDKVIYNEVVYICIQAHSSIITWEPDKAVSLWSIEN